MIYTSSINENSEFKRMYYRANFKSGFLTVIYLKKIDSKAAKLGITVSKKVGKAVVRNRTRRIILAAYRELEKKENLRGFSIVIVARLACSKVKMEDVLKELRRNIKFLRFNLEKSRVKKLHGGVVK